MHVRLGSAATIVSILGFRCHIYILSIKCTMYTKIEKPGHEAAKTIGQGHWNTGMHYHFLLDAAFFVAATLRCPHHICF